MTDDNSIDPEMAGDSRGDAIPVRPQREVDGERNSQPHASPEARRAPQRNPLEGIDLDALRDNPVLLAQVTAYLQENHLHLPILTPNREEMVVMREQTPELYALYVNGLQKSIDADFIQRTYPYTEPLKSADKGRWFGLVALLAVLALAGYALHLGHTTFAGIVIGLDLLGLIAVFGNTGTKNDSDRE